MKKVLYNICHPCRNPDIVLDNRLEDPRLEFYKSLSPI